MSWEGFELKIPASEQEKTVHALDRSATWPAMYRKQNKLRGFSPQSELYRPSDRHLSAKLVPDRLCGLVVRVPGYRSRGPCSIPGATKFSEK
jgi:hypothetical protein